METMLGVIYGLTTVVGVGLLSWFAAIWYPEWRVRTARTPQAYLAKHRIFDTLADGEWHVRTTVEWLDGRGDNTVNAAVLGELIRTRRVTCSIIDGRERVRYRPHFELSPRRTAC